VLYESELPSQLTTSRSNKCSLVDTGVPDDNSPRAQPSDSQIFRRRCRRFIGVSVTRRRRRSTTTPPSSPSASLALLRLVSGRTRLSPRHGSEDEQPPPKPRHTQTQTAALGITSTSTAGHTEEDEEHAAPPSEAAGPDQSSSPPPPFNLHRLPACLRFGLADPKSHGFCTQDLGGGGGGAGARPHSHAVNSGRDGVPPA
jgi:hypothetical protein